MQNFKDRLRELREERGLSMKELGKKIGVSDAAVCKWENGIAEPKVSYILQLADFFECSTDFLLGRNDDYASTLSEANEKPSYFTPSAKPATTASKQPAFISDGAIFSIYEKILSYNHKKDKLKSKNK